MTDAYTRILKPTDSTYVRVNTQGREQYDQANILYDDTSVFYDGVNVNAYTNVVKPVYLNNNYGIASGLLMPLTFKSTIPNDTYTRISKPTN